MTQFVVGFMFDDDQVVLIRKKRPAWQKGRLNGVGGHVEKGESPPEAMVREFEEETGVRHEDWKFFLSLNWEDDHIFFFRAYDPQAVQDVKTLTDEKVVRINVGDLSWGYTIDNLQWIVPLALQSGKYEEITVRGKNGQL